ncbi:MAG: membrane protein insertase YidC [Bacteroidales bacterium]|nr:membrane protein insertase YidC [Bacteroidales bacterium]
MDRNTIIGLGIIGLLLVGYSIFTKPQREAQMAERQRLDSIARVEQVRAMEASRQAQAQITAGDTGALVDSDSLSIERLTGELGDFANAASGTEEKVVLENDILKLTFSTFGGRPYTAQLKKYQTHDSLPLYLFDGDSTIFALQFFADNRGINTGELYFRPSIEKLTSDEGRSYQQLTMKMDVSETASISYIYRLFDEDYMLDFDMHFEGLDQYRTDRMEFNFDFYTPSQEKGYQNEAMYTTLYYKYHGGDVESFKSRSKKELEEVTETTRISWIAFSHQFFSTILVADEYFDGAFMLQERFSEPGKYVRRYSSSIDMPYDRTGDQLIGMQLYLGPNKFKSLKSYGDLGLENVVTVGGSMIRWINAFVVIPIFDWLDNYFVNFGIIILLLTLIIKMALFPLTYRSFKSQAVMRLLKPQVDEIGERYPRKEDAMKKQQATMDLYKKAGANPMGGCLPMLLQFPILYAMFRFFPTSIELRQEGFLWAHDLSTYDSILDLPWNIPMYGDHVSLFTLLMTVTTMLSMRYNNQAGAGSSQMPGMKTMMYIMPVMFMFILNNFSAGLTYYYFLANVITLGQNLIFKRFIDEDKIMRKIASKQNKPVKKSKFAQRLEAIQKQQQNQQSLGGRKPQPKKKSR